jgi:hypothetical protein
MDDSSLRFLRKTFDLLADGGVFDTDERCDVEKSLVDFRHPHELKVRVRNLERNFTRRNPLDYCLLTSYRSKTTDKSLLLSILGNDLETMSFPLMCTLYTLMSLGSN